MTTKMDLVIQNGRVIDGTGNPPMRADIAIADGKIVHLAQDFDSSNAKRAIDAEDLVICPGFVDTHSHDDAYLLLNPQCEAKVLQGVTTDVIGNCGFSLVPLTPEHRSVLKDTSAIMGGNYLPDDFWTISSFEEFLARLDRVKPGINVVPLVGHATIRIAAMGLNDRTPAQSELTLMKRLMTNAMQAGAFGLSN